VRSEESAVDTRWHSRLVARRRFGALVGGLAAELGPRVCLSRSDLPRRHPGRVEFHPPLPAGRFALPNDTYMGSVYKAIAVYWHPTVGQLCPRLCRIHANATNQTQPSAERATTATIRSIFRRTCAFGVGTKELTARHRGVGTLKPDTVRGTSMLFSCTITGSPTLTVLKYHSASSGLRLMQP
jgi:hypothetical protein